MIEYILLGTVAALYVLGTFQGSTIADTVEAYLEQQGEGYEINWLGRAFLTWLWPVATIVAMVQKEDDDGI